jgi:hypothetical protein
MRTISKLTPAAIAALSFLFSGNLLARQAQPASPGPDVTAAALHGIALSSMDKTCKPCQDFYRYANGE